MDLLKKQKLSKAQFEVLELMGKGWELGVDYRPNCYARLQKGGIGHGGECRCINIRTAIALRERGYIVVEDTRWPTTIYRLVNTQ